MLILGLYSLVDLLRVNWPTKSTAGRHVHCIGLRHNQKFKIDGCRHLQIISIRSHLTGRTILQHYAKSGLYVKKGSPYSITERRVPELIPVLGSQPAGNVSHEPGGRLPLLSARPAVTLATLKRAASSFAAW